MTRSSSSRSASPRPRQKASRSAAGSSGSGTTRSTMPAASRSADRTPWASAMSGARSTVRCMIADAPSGGSGASHACWLARTRSAGLSASAMPPVPCPMSRLTVGVGRVIRSLSVRAISGASPRSSASLLSAAPGVSMTLTSGRRSSRASRMPRRTSRSAAASSGVAWSSRSWPTTTQGASPKRASASTDPGCDSPSPVPLSRVTSVAASASSSRMPGRSSRRVRSTDSQAGTSGRSTAAAAGGATAWSSEVRWASRRAIITVSRRSSASASSAGVQTASMTPRSARLSDSCTPDGNGSPYRAS